MFHGEMLNTLLLIFIISHKRMGLMTLSQWCIILCSHWPPLPPLPSAVPCPLSPLLPHRKDPLYFQVLHTHPYHIYSRRLIPHIQQHMTPIFTFLYYPLFTPLAFLLPSNALTSTMIYGLGCIVTENTWWGKDRNFLSISKKCGRMLLQILTTCTQHHSLSHSWFSQAQNVDRGT